MPVFELDGDRARPVQPLQPLAAAFVPEVRALLAAQLSAVVGEPLFVVRSRTSLPEHADVPELLALDTDGRLVLVELMHAVDDGALVAALRHAGLASRMTTTDVARAYHPDPTRFAADYAGFRERVPFGPATTRRDGARLVLVCAEIAPETWDTVAGMCGPGRPVSVVQVGVLRGDDDRRLLLAEPLAAHETARRSVEPTGLRLVRTAEAAVAVGGSGPMTAPTANAPTANLPTPVVPMPAVPVSVAPVSAVPVSAAPTALHTPVGVPRPVGPRVDVDAPPPAFAAPVSAPASPTSTRPFGSPTAPLAPVSLAERGLVEPPEPLIVRPEPLVVAPGVAAPPDLGPVAPPTMQPTMHVDRPQDAWPELACLAKARRAVTMLVWLRERRGQRFEAMLRADGLLQLPDGSVYADPDAAAAHAAGGERFVDGWQVWRIGDGGPTLAQAVAR
jgi:hypothetical protein